MNHLNSSVSLFLCTILIWMDFSEHPGQFLQSCSNIGRIGLIKSLTFINITPFSIVIEFINYSIMFSIVPVINAMDNIKATVFNMSLIPISLIRTMNVAMQGKLDARTVQATTS